MNVFSSSSASPCPRFLLELTRKADHLMPLEQHGALWIRRGDLFVPYEYPINGDKVRQILHLLLNNLEKIQNEHEGLVATSSGVKANQGLIVSYVANSLGLKSVVAVGGDSSQAVINRHLMMKRCDDIGCKVDVVSKAGHPNLVFNRLVKKYPDAFIINFGVNNIEQPHLVLGPNAAQVASLPDDIENLVVPVGSGVSVSGVIQGLIDHDIHPKKLYLVQIAGKDRTESIDEMVGHKYPYEFIKFGHYPYSRWIQRSIQLDSSKDPIWLDGMNEAKVFEWLKENIDYENEKTVFWIVANSGYIRNLKPPPSSN